MIIRTRCERGRALGIATGITMLILSLAGGAGALSNSGGGSWQYYRDIAITNPGGALSDYQVLVNLSGAAFPARANASGADIRFEQGGAELSYWFEKWDYANASALVWVNVTDVPVGESVVRMWYGNERAAGVSDVTATFKRVIDGGQSLVGSWNFDEGTGTTAYDSSGKGSNGALINGPTWVDGKFGKALSFDGTNDHVRISDNDSWTFGSNPFSIAMWINFNSIPNGEKMMIANDEGGGGYNKWALEFLDTKIDFHINSPTIGAKRIAAYDWTPNIGKWYYLTISRNGDSYKLYINGTNVKTDINTDVIPNPNAPLTIGQGENLYVNAIIDEVRIFHTSLNNLEISDLYNNYGYTTTNYPGRVLIRRYASPEPSVISFGPIYPVPEIPTAAMMLIGVLALVGCWRLGKGKKN